MNGPDIVLDVYPVMPVDISSDEFWSEISTAIRSRGDLREMVFDLWSARCDSDTIMKILGITEAELEAIIPKSRWLASKWIKCPKCKGSGGYSTTVRWEEK